ncbi:hypothetical protein G9P44_001746 [Scheffersomyces stipitis]|nr:hypothetical protein G9P44_001746 [Scheffersomyces stipitis]
MSLRLCQKRFITDNVQLAKTRAAKTKQYAFYDLVLRTPSHPSHPIEASMMSASDYQELKKTSKTTFEGNYNLHELTREEKIARVFGNRIKGEAPRSSSRLLRGEPKVIAGVTVPERPIEPDNCCMSGCINCVWELFNDDVKDWNQKRKLAAEKLVLAGGRWPDNFHAPLKYLKSENYPLSQSSISTDMDESKEPQDAEDESWQGVPVAIRVFAETERLLKVRKAEREARKSEQTASA